MINRQERTIKQTCYEIQSANNDIPCQCMGVPGKSPTRLMPTTPDPVQPKGGDEMTEFQPKRALSNSSPNG